MAVLDEASKPYLVYGYMVRAFLEKKTKKRKHKLNTGEFYCPKCKIPRRSKPDAIRLDITATPLGKHARQAILKGLCESCDTRIIRFSSDKQIDEMTKKGEIFIEGKKVLIGIEGSPLNTDIEKGDNYEKCDKE